MLPETITKIKQFEDLLRKDPNSSVANASQEVGLGCEYEHEFTKGLYVRKMFLPKDRVFVTAVHLTEHPYFVMYGDVDVYVDGELKRIQGPFQGITKPGTQRVLRVYEDTLWITVHVTDKTDVEEICKETVVSTYDEYTKLLEKQEVV